MSHHEYPALRNGDDRGRAPYPVPRERDGEQACATADPELFFGEHGGPADRSAEAKELCNRCPFVAPCLAFAMARPSLYGIWGSLTADERRTIRRQKQRRAS